MMTNAPKSASSVIPLSPQHFGAKMGSENINQGD
jgi:hypothetical protein